VKSPTQREVQCGESERKEERSGMTVSHKQSERLAAKLRREMIDPPTISDGFGSQWSIDCPMCGRRSMQIVRPGSAQCEHCG